MSISKPNGYRNVPPPEGSRAGLADRRFIPREELGNFESWKPGTFGGAPAAAPPATSPIAPPPPPAEPGADEWRERIHTARRDGYQEGYRDGLAALEGFKQTFAQQATAQIGALLDAFDRQFEALDGEIAQTVTETAVQLARQVLRAELQMRPELVATIASEAANAVMLSARHITVHVHPLDLPLVAEGAEEALSARGGRLLADPGIERGGVLVQSDIGAIDARVATRWSQAASALGSQQPLRDEGDTP